MPFTTLSLGLTLTIPTNGTKNWGTTVLNTTWTKISNHGHTGSGDGNQIVAAGLASESVTTAKLAKNIGFKQYASTLTPVGTTQTVDWNNGMIQFMTLASASGTVTVTLSNGTQGGYYELFVTQGATPRDITWPASVKWPQGQKVILSTTNGYTDKIKLYFDGTNYYGDWDLQYA